MGIRPERPRKAPHRPPRRLADALPRQGRRPLWKRHQNHRPGRPHRRFGRQVPLRKGLRPPPLDGHHRRLPGRSGRDSPPHPHPRRPKVDLRHRLRPRHPLRPHHLPGQRLPPTQFPIANSQSQFQISILKSPIYFAAFQSPNIRPSGSRNSEMAPMPGTSWFSTIIVPPAATIFLP